jgi:threonyl-tRNA synthetase
MINITFPNNIKKSFAKNTKGLAIAESISLNFAKTCIAIEINGEILDLNSKIDKDSKIYFITNKDSKALEIMRHTAAHIMAQAILRLYPNAKLTIGPVIKDGFYYDIDTKSLSTDDFPKIEIEMEKIIKANLPISKNKISKKDALNFYKKNFYKTEMISDLQDETISFYKQGDFTDLCKGPHVPNTSFVKFIKLIRVSGAYWRANQSKQQLQRIYGTAFFKKKDLDLYIDFLKESKKRNHRKIGLKMNLFSFHREAPGMPLFHPKGMHIWNAILECWKEKHQKAGYLEIKTPIMLHRNLWEISGHWENYKENMYTSKIDNHEYVIKPMNCPGSMLFYKNSMHSYKDFPMKIAEIGLVHRHELSGVLNGLFRVRSFHQDDAHIFIKQDQITNEILNLLIFEKKMYSIFGLKFELELSTRPEKFIGSLNEWEITTNALNLALEKFGQDFTIKNGEGAFYGPKIDLHVKDALNRTWQCGTIQLDMSLPERFGLNYINKNNEKHRPLVIHRTVFGSIERFLGILIEHFAGKFPLWMSPTPVIILPINDDLINSAKKITDKMISVGISAKIDTRTESLSKKIRNAQLSKIPLIIIYGKKEKKSKTLSIRTTNGEIFKNVNIDNFIKNLVENIKKRRINFEPDFKKIKVIK